MASMNDLLKKYGVTSATDTNDDGIREADAERGNPIASDTSSADNFDVAITIEESIDSLPDVVELNHESIMSEDDIGSTVRAGGMDTSENEESIPGTFRGARANSESNTETKTSSRSLLHRGKTNGGRSIFRGTHVGNLSWSTVFLSAITLVGIILILLNLPAILSAIASILNVIFEILTGLVILACIVLVLIIVIQRRQR